MYIARLNFGNHCRHENQPMTEKSDQVRGFLEILALREVRKEERAGEKSFSSPRASSAPEHEDQEALGTRDLKS